MKRSLLPAPLLVALFLPRHEALEVRASGRSSRSRLMTGIRFVLSFCAALVAMPWAAFAVTLYGTNADTGVLYRIDNNGIGTPFVAGLNNPNALAVSTD